MSKACKMMGFSRDTFYRYKSAKEQGGVKASSIGADVTQHEESGLSLPTPQISLLMVRHVPATNYGNTAYLFRHQQFVQSGCVMGFITSSCV